MSAVRRLPIPFPSGFPGPPDFRFARPGDTLSALFAYRVLSVLALLVYAPYALLRSLFGRRRIGNLRGRLGSMAYPDLAGGIWIHAVSVGEVGVARNLLAGIRRREPSVPLGLSVTTAAGMEMARGILPPDVAVFAFPLDFAGPVERALSSVRPGLVLLTETELWPLFLDRASRRGIPVALVNGRVSERSASRYRWAGRVFSSMLGRVAIFAMQSQADATRIRELGASADRVKVTGNVKFDLPEAPPFSDARLSRNAAGRPVFVAASTAEGEEALVLEAWESLPAESRPVLAVAPRRPERFGPVAELIAQRGHAVVRRSQTDNSEAESPGDAAVYLLDSIGELASLYREARIAFIGGSLVPVGGHNPIEAWAAGVPTLVGPHTGNFREIVAEGERLGILERVSGAPALAAALAGALADPASLARRSDAARRAVAEGRGAGARTADLVLPLRLESPGRKGSPEGKQQHEVEVEHEREHERKGEGESGIRRPARADRELESRS